MQFHFWEYINWNQTFILDSHRPFIYSVLILAKPLTDKTAEEKPEQRNVSSFYGLASRNNSIKKVFIPM
jgi:hypothetical protein